MDHLQTDIVSLESEKGELKEKLRQKGGSATTPSLESATSLIGSGNTSLPSGPVHEGELQKRIYALQEALRHESRHKRTLVNQDLQKKLDSLPPLPKFDERPKVDPKIKEFMDKKAELLRVIVQVYKGKFFRPKLQFVLITGS